MNIEILSLEDLKKKAKMRGSLLCPYLESKRFYRGGKYWKCRRYNVEFCVLLGKETSEGKDCMYRELCKKEVYNNFTEMNDEFYTLTGKY